MTARGRVRFWLVANGIYVLLVLAWVIYVFTSKAGAQVPSVGPGTGYCRVFPLALPPGSLIQGTAVCFDRDADGRLRLVCAYDLELAAVLKTEVCSYGK